MKKIARFLAAQSRPFNGFTKESGCPTEFPNEKGSVLFIVILLMSTLALIPMMMNTNKISNENTKMQQTIALMADNMSLAGIRDAVKWFKRQPAQPVNLTTHNASNIALGLPVDTNPDRAFFPRADPLNPTQHDTIDESVGLVKAYPLSKKYTEEDAAGVLQDVGKSQIWGRYEVVRQEVNAAGFLDADHPFNLNAVHDISSIRIPGSAANAGMVWQIESKSYIYRLEDPLKPFNEAPNAVLGSARTGTEIWRLSAKLPVDAALIVNNISLVSIVNNPANGLISGVSGLDSPAIAYYTKDNLGDENLVPNVTGSPRTIDINSEPPISAQNIFGVAPAKLRELADMAAASFDDLPDKTPERALVYIAENAVIDSNSSSSFMSGIAYVNGSLTINNGAVAAGLLKFRFSGLLFVAGNLVINGPAQLNGTVIVTGSVVINSGGVQFTYDNNAMTSARMQLAEYRENRSAIHSVAGLFK